MTRCDRCRKRVYRYGLEAYVLCLECQARDDDAFAERDALRFLQRLAPWIAVMALVQWDRDRVKKDTQMAIDQEAKWCSEPGRYSDAEGRIMRGLIGAIRLALRDKGAIE